VFAGAWVVPPDPAELPPSEPPVPGAPPPSPRVQEGRIVMAKSHTAILRAIETSFVISRLIFVQAGGPEERLGMGCLILRRAEHEG
jgi:hypothetical protein